MPSAIGVQMRFLYPLRMGKWILRTLGERWRQHKSNLKSIYFDVHKSMEANCNNVPPGVNDDQWVALVNNWMTEKSQVPTYCWIYVVLNAY